MEQGYVLGMYFTIFCCTCFAWDFCIEAEEGDKLSQDCFGASLFGSEPFREQGLCYPFWKGICTFPPYFVFFGVTADVDPFAKPQYCLIRLRDQKMPGLKSKGHCKARRQR